MHTQQRRAGVGLALATFAGLALTLAVMATTASAGPTAPIEWAPLATGFNNPVDLAVTGVTTDTRLFVAEIDGRIKIMLDTGTVLTTTFLDLTAIVDSESNSEVGLLGLTFDPDYATNGAFYVYYNDQNGNMQLSRFQVSVDPNVALTTEVKLLTIPHPTAYHNGGAIAFGPDGYLYVTPGDGGDGYSNNGQAFNTLLGKMLRLNVSGQVTYTVPATNPYTQTVDARPEIWARGLRNAWRFSFDQATGNLYLGDVGEQLWEEISYLPAGSPGGADFGWGCYEGFHEFHPAPFCPPLAELTMPLYEYSHAVGQAVVGGYVYRGAAYPYLDGYYFFADAISRRFFALNTKTHTTVALGQMLSPGALPVVFGQDALGEIYVADFGAGTIYKLIGHAPVAYEVFLPQVGR